VEPAGVWYSGEEMLQEGPAEDATKGDDLMPSMPPLKMRIMATAPRPQRATAKLMTSRMMFIG
jgi:hypothetical protein